MTIASQLTRLETNLLNAYDMLEEKHATLPLAINFDNLTSTIETASPYVLHEGYNVTLNNKSHQQISAHFEKMLMGDGYETTSFTTGPVYAKFKLHLYINSTDAGYKHGALSWSPNTFVNGGYLTSDLVVDVTDAEEIGTNPPAGYEDYYLHNSVSNFYEDTNYDNYVTRTDLTGNIIFYDLDNWLPLASRSFSSMFNGCSTVTNINLLSLDTSKVSSFASMFENCSSLTSIDVSNFNTVNSTSFATMFYGCSSLTSIDVSNFNTSNATSFASMFNGCSALTSIDVSNFNTSNATSIGGLFYQCSLLETIDVTTFNTSNVIAFPNVFAGCSSLTSIDLSNWDTSNATDIKQMFENCSSLIAVDLSNWDTGKVEDRTSWSSSRNMRRLFVGCSSLQYIVIDSSAFKFVIPTDISNLYIPSTCKILVPQALLSTYQSATNWSVIASQFDIIENYTITRSNGQVTVTPN